MKTIKIETKGGVHTPLFNGKRVIKVAKHKLEKPEEEIKKESEEFVEKLVTIQEIEELPKEEKEIIQRF